MITPVTDSIPELFQYLAAVYDVTARSMPKEEMIWPLSMPPALPEKDEEIIIAKLKNFEDVLYRRYLAKEYGKRKQMVSGIHFNFEFGDELLRTLFSHQEEFQDFSEFKTELYLKTARNFMRYRWMITYLFGASPMSEKNYFLDESHPQEPVRSIRNSALGYTNHPNGESFLCFYETVFSRYRANDRRRETFGGERILYTASFPRRKESRRFSNNRCSLY